LAIRNFHDSGNRAMVRSPLGLLAALFHRLGRYEPAATVAGFAINPLAAAAFPETSAAIAQMRDVLGDQTYESLARKGVVMTTLPWWRSRMTKSTRPEQNSNPAKPS
jgi:hypothetical protein